jgi:FAD-dependent urate hydroxylase
MRLPGDVPERLRRYERRRIPRVRLVSRMAASEITMRPAGPLARPLARLLPASFAGRAYAALIRRFSNVLRNEHP